MKILLDECLPRRLKNYIKDHEVATVPEAGWAGIKNGELLKKAVSEFDVFITADRNLSYQQSPKGLAIPVIVMKSHSNRMEDLLGKMNSLQLLLNQKLERKTYII